MDTSTSILPVVSCGYDWITCTAPNDDQGRALIATAEDAMTDAQQGHNFIEPFHFQGYHGFKKGLIRWGWSKQGGIVIMSGWCAQDYAGALALQATHWSRVDYQVTVWDETGERNLGREAWENWRWREDPARGPCRPTVIEQMGASTSFYTGHRSSSRFGRIYDKHEESPRAFAAGCWRYEIELKREQSEMAQGVERHSRVTDVDIQNVIKGYYDGLDVAVAYKADGQVRSSGRCCREYDADRVAEWLERQVAPSVQKLSEARGTDYVRRLLHL